MRIKPAEWQRLSVEKRFAQTVGGPKTLDVEARTVDAVVSKGSPVRRYYGVEKLRISRSAVDLTRLQTTGIPTLDSHQQVGLANVLGQFVGAWIEGVALMGRIRFAETPEGDRAMGMVERGEIKGISAGYTVSEWEIRDKSGRLIDPEVERLRIEDDLTFEATRWELLEGSLVSVAADPAAIVRSHPASPFDPSRVFIRDVRARMQARQRMIDRLAHQRQGSRSASFYGRSGNPYFK